AARGARRDAPATATVHTDRVAPSRPRGDRRHAAGPPRRPPRLESGERRPRQERLRVDVRADADVDLRAHVTRPVRVRRVPAAASLARHRADAAPGGRLVIRRARPHPGRRLLGSVAALALAIAGVGAAGVAPAAAAAPVPCTGCYLPPVRTNFQIQL